MKDREITACSLSRHPFEEAVVLTNSVPRFDPQLRKVRAELEQRLAAIKSRNTPASK